MSILAASHSICTTPCCHFLSFLPLRKYFWSVLQIKFVDALGGEEWALILIRGGEHRRDKAAGAGSGDVVEVVGQPCVGPVQLLHAVTVDHHIHTPCMQLDWFRHDY